MPALATTALSVVAQPVPGMFLACLPMLPPMPAASKYSMSALAFDSKSLQNATSQAGATCS